MLLKHSWEIYIKMFNTWGYLHLAQKKNIYIFTIHSSVSLVPFDWGHWSHINTIKKKEEEEREKKEIRIIEGKTGRYKRVGAEDIHWHFYTFLCVMLFRSWMESGPPPPSASPIHRRPPTLNEKKRKFIGKTDQFSPLRMKREISSIASLLSRFQIEWHNFDCRAPIQFYLNFITC